MDYDFEAAADAEKRAWQARHKWRNPAPEVWASAAGEINGKLADRISEPGERIDLAAKLQRPIAP